MSNELEILRTITEANRKLIESVRIDVKQIRSTVTGCIDDLRMIADGPGSIDKSAAMHQIADRLAQIVGRED